MGGADRGGGQRHDGALPPKEAIMGKGTPDLEYGDLWRAVPKSHERDKHRNAWISKEMWRVPHKRVSEKRGTIVRARLRRLGRAFRASLKGDRKRRVEDAGKDVEALLGGYPQNAKEAWRWMRGGTRLQ